MNPLLSPPLWLNVNGLLLSEFDTAFVWAPYGKNTRILTDKR